MGKIQIEKLEIPEVGANYLSVEAQEVVLNQHPDAPEGAEQFMLSGKVAGYNCRMWINVPVMLGSGKTYMEMILLHNNSPVPDDGDFEYDDETLFVGMEVPVTVSHSDDGHPRLRYRPLVEA